MGRLEASVARPFRAHRCWGRAMTRQPRAQFGYDSLGDLSAELRETAARIRARAASAFLDIGRELLAAKGHFPRGRFVPWVEIECGIGIRSAQRMMNAARMAEGKSDTVSRLSPSVLYALSAPATPAGIGEAIIARTEAGEAANV